MNRPPPSLADLEALAETGWLLIPENLRARAVDVLIRVEDFPSDEVCRAMGLESPFDVLGLYQGIALTEKSMADISAEPDMVFLYRRPILDYWCETGEDLGHVVRHVLIHEIGHHFGFSDADMHQLEEHADAAERAASQQQEVPYGG